jgi:hypothetical protein
VVELEHDVLAQRTPAGELPQAVEALIAPEFDLIVGGCGAGPLGRARADLVEAREGVVVVVHGRGPVPAQHGRDGVARVRLLGEGRVEVHHDLVLAQLAVQARELEMGLVVPLVRLLVAHALVAAAQLDLRLCADDVLEQQHAAVEILGVEGNVAELLNISAVPRRGERRVVAAH